MSGGNGHLEYKFGLFYFLDQSVVVYQASEVDLAFLEKFSKLHTLVEL